MSTSTSHRHPVACGLKAFENDHLKVCIGAMSAQKLRGSAYFPAIDGLRAIAIIAVVVFHLQSDWPPGGLAGVDIDFVVSGFVVTLSTMTRGHRGRSAMVTGSNRQRIMRIMPPLVVMLLSTSLASKPSISARRARR